MLVVVGCGWLWLCTQVFRVDCGWLAMGCGRVFQIGVARHLLSLDFKENRKLAASSKEDSDSST
jgi:hypothetical protein